MRKVLKAQDMTVVELIRRVNALQKEAGYLKRPMGQQAFYHYMAGHAPPQERLYAIAAILGKHPRQLFGIKYYEDKLKKYKNLIPKVGVVPRV